MSDGGVQQGKGFWDELKCDGRIIVRHYNVGLPDTVRFNPEAMGIKGGMTTRPQAQIPYAVPGWKCNYCDSFYADGRVAVCQKCGHSREVDG